MWIRFLDEPWRTITVVLGVFAIVASIASGDLRRRRRRYSSPWDVPTADDPPGARKPLVLGVDDDSLLGRQRPFRRPPRSRAEAVAYAVVIVAATAVLILVSVAFFVFLTNLPGWR